MRSRSWSAVTRIPARRNRLGGEYCPTGVIPEFSATATTIFEFYCEGTSHSAELHLLDPDNDMPRNLTAIADPASATLDIAWDPVGEAEWYSLKVRSKYNFAGPYMTGSVYSVSNEAYFYLELTPLSAGADESGGEWITPPSLRELIRPE
jgi:hypothetical protein